MSPHLYLPYDGKNSFPGRFVVAKNIIYKQLAKDLKYSRQITVIRSQNKRVVSDKKKRKEKIYNMYIKTDSRIPSPTQRSNARAQFPPKTAASLRLKYLKILHFQTKSIIKSMKR